VLDDASQNASIIHQFDPQTPLPTNIKLVDPEKQDRAIQQNDRRCIGVYSEGKSSTYSF